MRAADRIAWIPIAASLNTNAPAAPVPVSLGTMADIAKAALARITVGSAITGKDMKMFEISFDLETLSLDADAQILSIGAVKFDRETKELGEQFYLIIDIGAGHPGKVDGATVMWWMGRSAEARAAVFGAEVQRVPLLEALGLFSQFCEGVTQYWQRGDKDAQWLEASYKRVGLPAPFRFWELNDQRTLTKAFQHKIPHIEHGGAHNALEDALFQARCILAIL